MDGRLKSKKVRANASKGGTCPTFEVEVVVAQLVGLVMRPSRMSVAHVQSLLPNVGSPLGNSCGRVSQELYGMPSFPEDTIVHAVVDNYRLYEPSGKHISTLAKTK